MHNTSYRKDNICPFRTLVSWYNEDYDQKFLMVVTDDFGTLVRSPHLIPHGFTLGVEGKY